MSKKWKCGIRFFNKPATNSHVWDFGFNRLIVEVLSAKLTTWENSFAVYQKK